MKKKILPRVFFDVEVAGNSVGRIVFELFSDVCPKTTENFRSLCTGEHGMGDTTGKPLHYKGVIFHRVVRDFMVQSGDFSEGNGRGGESIYGGYFADESFTHKHDRPFLLSMANRGKNTNGSQFFITTQPTPHLDGVHVVFGRVVDGEAIVKKIEAQPTDANSRPKNECKIVHCGELILAKTKKVKAKKKKDSVKDSVDEDSGRSSQESSDSEKESKKKKKKKKRKSKKEKKEKHRPEKDSSAEEDVKEDRDLAPEVSRSTVSAEEVPPVPEQKFLMRSNERRESERTTSTNTPASTHSQGRKWVSRSGRKVKGRGVLRYRTPSRSRSRSPRRRSFHGRRGSETPPHWREAQRGQRPLHEVVGSSRDSPESGRWRRKSLSPDKEDEHKHRSNENKTSLIRREKDEGEKENKHNRDRHSRHRSRDREYRNRSSRGSEGARKHDPDRADRSERSSRKYDSADSKSRDRGSGNNARKGDDNVRESTTANRRRQFRENLDNVKEKQKEVDDAESRDVLEEQHNEIEITADDHKDDKSSPRYDNNSSAKEESDVPEDVSPPGESNKKMREDSSPDTANEKENATGENIDVDIVKKQDVETLSNAQGDSPSVPTEIDMHKAKEIENTIETQQKDDSTAGTSTLGHGNRKSHSPRKRSRSSSRKRRRSISSSRKRSRSRRKSRSPKRRSRSRSRRRHSYYSRRSRSRSRDRRRPSNARHNGSRDGRRSRYGERRRSRSRSPRRRSPDRRASYRSRRQNSRSRSSDKRRSSRHKSKSKDKDSRSPRKNRSSSRRRGHSSDSSSSRSSDSD